MSFLIRPLNMEDACEIADWQYAPPHDVYNLDGQVDGLLDGAYYSLREEPYGIVAFGCFGADAQVSGGRAAGAYDDLSAIDFGLGLRPDLVGKGRGIEFLGAMLAFAGLVFEPTAFRLTVALWNVRAIRLYEKAGFQREQVFPHPPMDGADTYMSMRKALEAEKEAF